MSGADLGVHFQLQLQASSDSDIHICGLCRANFDDIYDFIEHKKNCAVNRVSTSHHLSKTTVHNESVEVESRCLESDHQSIFDVTSSCDPNYPTQTKVGPDVGSIHYDHVHQPIESEKIGQQPSNSNVRFILNRSTSVPQPPNVTHLSNLIYSGTQPEIDTTQCQASVRSTLIHNRDQPTSCSIQNLTEQCFSEVYSTLTQTIFRPSDEDGTFSKVSHNLLDSSKEATTESSLESPTLCPEDLEVGQISEAMIGKLSEKFYPKIQRHTTKKCSSKNNTLGKLDPISTFAVRKKNDVAEGRHKSLSKLFCNKDVARMNSSSVPLSSYSHETSSQLKEISFEKRERLQGVSDELFDIPPLNADAVGFKANFSQNVAESTVSYSDEVCSVVKSPKQSTSIYKAVFTSPSCGGNRLALTTPDTNQIVSHGETSPRGIINTQPEIGENNISTSYRNISKVAAIPQINTVNIYSQNGTNCAVYEGTMEIETEAERQHEDKGSGNQITVSKDILNHLSQQPSFTSMKIAPDHTVMPYSIVSDNQIVGIENRSTLGSKSCQNVLEANCSIASVKYVHPISSIPVDAGLEPEMVQMAPVNQLWREPWSSTEVGQVADANLVEMEKSNGLEKEDTVVIVYKREDNSVIMMYKPKQGVGNEHFVSRRPDGGDEHQRSTVTLESGVEAKVDRRQGSEYHSLCMQSVVEKQPGEFYLSQNNPGQDSKLEFITQQQQAVSLYSMDQQNCVTESFPSTGLVVNNIRPFEIGEQSELQVPSSSEELMLDRVGVTLPKAVAITNDNFDNGKQRRNQTDMKLKSSSLPLPTTNEKSRNKEYVMIASNAGDHITSNNTREGHISKKETKDQVKAFKCLYGDCSYSTAIYKDFERHYRIHTGERPFRCDECGKSFNRSDKLKTHLRCHSGQKPFQCKQCNYASSDSGSLKKHIRIHTNERPFQCQICPYASRNSSQLIVHLRTHTGDAPFHCNICSAQFKVKSDLKRHLRIHTGEKPFHCDKCDYRSSNKGNLKTHYNINHSSENEKSCPQCNFTTSSIKRLQEHIKIHDAARIVKCSVCSYTCNSSAALRSHMMVHNSLRPFSCSFCPYSSKQSGNLKKHTQNVHQDKHKMVALVGSKRDAKLHLKKKSRSCKDNTDYRRMRRTTSSRKIHMCNICDSGFVRLESLRCHLRQHGEKEFPANNNQRLETTSMAMSQTQPPPTSNIPPPPVVYRRLDHIVAAASQLYREQYMNGDDLTDHIDNKSTNQSDRLQQLDNQNMTHINSHRQPEAGINDVSLSSKTMKTFAPIIQTNMSALRSLDEVGNIKRKINTRERLNYPPNCIDSESCTEAQEQGQIPWEHRCYTVSGNNDRTRSSKKSHRQTNLLSKHKKLSPVSVKAVPSLPPKCQIRNKIWSSPRQQPSPKSSKNLLSRPDCPSHIKCKSSDDTRFESPTVNIQVVPRMTSINPVTPQLSFTPQELVSPLSISPNVSSQAQSAIQIVLPAGTQMTQIIPTGPGTGQPSMNQPQIMFQVSSPVISSSSIQLSSEPQTAQGQWQVW